MKAENPAAIDQEALKRAVNHLIGTITPMTAILIEASEVAPLNPQRTDH